MSWKIRALLRCYPRSWRDEYGEEFANVLGRRPLTVPVFANVIGNGILQRLYRDEPWKICGAFLALLVPLQSVLRMYFSQTWIAFATLFGVGAWTVLRENSGILRATTATVLTALIFAISQLLFICYRVLIYGHGWVGAVGSAPPVAASLPWRPMGMLLVITLRQSVLLGFAGALLGRGAASFTVDDSKGPRPETT